VNAFGGNIAPYPPVQNGKEKRGGLLTMADYNHFVHADRGIFPVTDPLYGAKGDGATDDTTAIRAALAAAIAAKGVLYFPPGTYLVAPTTTAGLTLGNNLEVRGAGEGLTTIKVSASAGNWAKLLDGTAGADNLVVSDLTIDCNNVNNSSAAISVGSPTTHQVALYVAGGNNVRASHVTFLTGGLNTCVLGGGMTGAEVSDCKFVFTVRSGNAQYDNSAIYTVARDAVIARNQFVGDSSTTAGKGAVTAIETHGGTTTIVGNTCRAFMNMMNVCTGVASAGRVTVTGNTGDDINQGIQIWPIDAPGFDGLVVVGNTFGITNVTHNRNLSSGIKLVDDAAATQPVRSLVVANNTIRFQDEGAGRATDYAGAAVSPVESCGIGIRARGNVTGLRIEGNIIELAPGRGIVVGQSNGAPTYANVAIESNVLLNPGQNLGLSIFQRHGISIFNTLTDVTVRHNFIKDDFATTRCWGDIFTAPSGGTFTRVTCCRNLTAPATTPLTSSYDASVLRWDDTQVPTPLRGSATWNPPSQASGAAQTFALTVTGAALGDYATCSFSLDLSGTSMVAYVSAANTVTVVHSNLIGGPVDLGSGTLRAAVWKP
jgi:hypothetical protein